MYNKLVAIFISILLSGLFSIEAQDFSMLGSFRVRNYPQKEYKANAQIFGISEDQNQNIIFTNQRGLIQYDGVDWRVIQLPDERESFASYLVDDNILIATTSGLGQLKANENGDFEFTDLYQKYSNDPAPVSQIVKFGNYYAIGYPNSLYVLNDDFTKIAEYKDQNSAIGAVSVVDEQLYFRGKNKEIFTFENEKFSTISNGSFFSDKQVISILKFNKDLLFITDTHIYKETGTGEYEYVFMNPEIRLKSCLNIKDEYLSIGAYVDGLILLDQNYDPKYSIDANKGLNDGTILCQHMDHEGNLWLGTSNGISKIDLLSPVMGFTNVFSEATIEGMEEYDGSIALATGGGAYLMNEEGELSKIEGINNDCFDIKKLNFGTDTSLYISGLDEVFKYNREGLEIVTAGGPYTLAKSPLNENHLVVLHYDGIQLLEYKNGNFEEINYIRGFCEGEPFNFEIEDDGTIWIGTKPDDGVYKLDMNVFFENEIHFERFHTEQGLPNGQTYMFKYKNNIYAGTDAGIFIYDKDKFISTSEFGIDFAKEGMGVHRINCDKDDNVWMVLFDDIENKYQIGFSDASNNMKWHPEYFYSYDEYIVHSVFHSDNGISWIGGPGGLMRFDKEMIRTNESEYHTQIRNITLGDSTIFMGNGTLPLQQVFDYDKKNLIEFKFTSNSFYAEDKNQYSYFLEGYDSEWSEYSLKTSKEFNLSEGVYTFSVKSKTALGIESEITSYEFEILPPWYRTWWAYLLFGLALILLIYFVVLLSLSRVKSQNIKLEKTVEERTQEVVAQKAEAEKQRDYAEEQKHLVEEKNIEIMDSINYAKRLQNAILTPVKVIQETFLDSFIFYLPKDIVAGDFYWTNLAKQNNRNKRNLIATADCTGHGVPGAMVSVVCSNALDRSVKEFGLTKPGEILDKVTDLVIETFEKSEDEVKDGMDIALCSIEKQESSFEVQYAGANNALWVARSSNEMMVNGEIQVPMLSDEDNRIHLFEVKATKQPVGKYAERKSFKTNIIKLEKGDILYTFTDGYADQFGGEKGKKYKYLPFKRFIISLYDKPMNNQEDSLSADFKNWKGDIEQIDDVCVIGIRL